MSHFRRIVTVDDRLALDRRSTLFSMPSDVVPHAAAEVRVEVGRYFLGMVNVGEVISSGHDTFVTEPAGATLIVPRSGRITSAGVGDITRTASVGEALLFSPNRRQTRVAPDGAARFVGIPLVFPREELAETAAMLGLSTGSRRRLDAFSLSIAAARSAEMRDLIALTDSIYAAIADGSPALLGARAQRSWSLRLMEKLVCVLDAAEVVRLPGAGGGRAAGRHVRRALEFMRAQYADIETIADVAEACAIGTRTLEASFRQVWSQSPHAALTEIRLEAARRLLTGERAAATVTEVAFDSGFNHLGRFAGAYRTRFDESPSQTLRRTLL